MTSYERSVEQHSRAVLRGLGCGGSGLGPEEREGDDVPDRRGGSRRAGRRAAVSDFMATSGDNLGT